MDYYYERALQLSREVIELLERDYEDLKGDLDGDIYDEYKALVMDEIELAHAARMSLKNLFR